MDSAYKMEIDQRIT